MNLLTADNNNSVRSIYLHVLILARRPYLIVSSVAHTRMNH